MRRDGEVIECSDDNVAELETRAQTCLDSELPLFAALGVAEHPAPAGFGD